MAERARLLTRHNYRKWLLFEAFRKLERTVAGSRNFNTAIANPIINLQDRNIPPPPCFPRIKYVGNQQRYSPRPTLSQGIPDNWQKHACTTTFELYFEKALNGVFQCGK